MEVLSRSFLGDGTYTTYPHMNAFVPGGREFTYMQARPDGTHHFYRHHLDSRENTFLAEVRLSSRRGMSWDIAPDGDKLVAIVFNNRAHLLDLNDPREFICVYEPARGAHLDGLCSLSRDGRKLLCRERAGDLRKAIEIDLATREVRTLFAVDWHANHFHYCLHDEAWVGFAHEGPTDQIPDRCWVWHAEHAPKGKIAFDQASDTPGVRLYVGHERWGFHDVSAYVIAYAHSPAGKRGLYEIFADDRPAKLLWESDLLWHCTMDATGRFAAVDTTGPFREEPLSDEAYRRYLDLHLQTDRDQGENDSDVVLLDLQTRQSLYIATARRSRHPYHPHPAISPDARWIAWNDCRASRRGAWIVELSR